MNHSEFLLMQKHLRFEIYSSSKDSLAYNQLRSAIKQKGFEVYDLPYIIALTEYTGELIMFCQTSNPNFNTENFYFYLKKLPNVTYNNVLMLLTLAFTPGSLVAFKLSKNYPSLFAAEVLKETYGYLLYHYQLENLISSCRPYLTSAEYYRKGLNRKESQIVQTLEVQYLPDNVPLKKLLYNFMPLGKSENTDGLGCLISPPFAEAYLLYEKMKKWKLEIK